MGWFSGTEEESAPMDIFGNKSEEKGTFEKMQDKVFGKPEEEKTAMDKLEEGLDDCCPTLTWTQVRRPSPGQPPCWQRLVGFVVCCAIGIVLTFGSFARFAQCIGGNCAAFAVMCVPVGVWLL